MDQSRRNRKMQLKNIEPHSKTSYKVENTLSKIQASANVADRMQNIVAQEFDKIKKILNL